MSRPSRDPKLVGMKLSPADFNAHLRHMGQSVQWRRAVACPCRDRFSGAARPDCAHCAGKGWQWSALQPGHVGVSGMQRQRQWAQLGRYETGDVVVTLPSDSPIYGIGETDRVLFTDNSNAFSTSLVRGRDDRAWPWPIQHIERLFWLETGLQQIVDAQLPALPDDDAVFLDMYPTPEAWLAACLPTPPLNQTYSLTGRYFPEYFVWGDLVQTRHHHDGFDLPRHVVLRRVDLFGR